VPPNRVEYPGREPAPVSERQTTMKPIRRTVRPLGAVLIIGALGLAACGSDDSETQLPPPLDTGGTPTVPDASELPEPGPASTSNSPAGQGDEVLGTGNVGGTVVDPEPHPIDDIAVAESYPEQLMIRFTSGDPNCTAADATAIATGSAVIVTLRVGLTEDALRRSCLAGDFEQTVAIALDAGLDGREVIAAEI